MMILKLALLQVPLLLVYGFRAPGSGEDANLVDMLKSFSFEKGRSSVFPPIPTAQFLGPGDDGNFGPYEGKVCFEKFPFCMFISGTTRIEYLGDTKRKSSLRTDAGSREQFCFTDFQVRNCDDFGFHPKFKRIDFDNVKVKDFCFPQGVGFGGTLGVGQTLTSSHTVYATFKNADRTHGQEELRSPQSCPGSDFCFLKDVDEILKWNSRCDTGFESLPCQTPVNKGTYNLEGVTVNFPPEFFQNSTLSNGLIFGKVMVYVDNGPMSCAFVSFRRFTRLFFEP